MKVLICTPEYYPNGSGIANVAYNIVGEMEKKGINCIVCSPTGPDIKLGSERLIKKYGIIGLIYYWYQVSMYFKNKKDYFDISWCHNPLFVKNNPFDKCIVTMHSTYYGEFSHGTFPIHIKLYKKIASVVEKCLLRHLKSDVIFTGVSSSVCEELKIIGIDNKKIKYIPNGADIELFKPSDKKLLLREKFRIPPGNLILLSVGRLTQVKQPLQLIEMYSIIEKKEANISLVIAGNGELLAAAKKLAKEKNLSSIIFLGYVDHIKEAPDLYACSDFYILISKYEGQPLTLLEAMSSGLPCIVSDIPNLHMVADANCGTIINCSDPQIAAQNIVKYIKENHLNHSNNSRKYAEDNFNWSVIANKYLNEFHKPWIE